MKIILHLQQPDVPAFTLQPRHLERLRALFPSAALAPCETEAQLLAALPGATHALVWRFKPEWLALAPRLRVIATPAAGREGLAFQPPPGVRLVFGSFHGPLIAQTVLAQLLAFHRGLLHADRLMRGGDPWPRAALAPRLRDLRGTHALILGFGHIGQAIGRILKPLGIRVTGLRRDLSQPVPDWFTDFDNVTKIDRIDALLPDADHLVCALPATPETTLLLDARRLALLPSRAVVCNIGRGNLIDEAALCGLLHAGKLAGALLDVFQREPLPDADPLRSAPNAFLLPHASAIAPNYLDLWFDELLPQWERGAPPCAFPRAGVPCPPTPTQEFL